GGADVFADNCSTCHVNGGNVISAGKVLSKTAIEEYLDGGYTKEAIEYQVRNGKGPMPAWEGVLSEDEIVAVTDYVYTQAGGAWANVS
uniref:Cytochrome c6 n=3 Tax=Euglena gracilis TaxID=3039 RepID=CYC6_EUGGR|nr:RecName: Full=Cytochrome c6; AltName: Full=Cytochrome c-552; AltName: Full=Cytochrome c-553; AltName: Full=Cytochrome c553; AltName: Full=Soluble cytochrome f [Euglena gracilis]